MEISAYDSLRILNAEMLGWLRCVRKLTKFAAVAESSGAWAPGPAYREDVRSALAKIDELISRAALTGDSSS